MLQIRAMEKLLEYFNAEHGRRKQLALALGITPGAVSQWEKVPVERLDEIERLTGIPRHELCPEFFEGYSPSEILKSTEAA